MPKVGERPPDILYYVRESGRVKEYQTSDAARFTSLRLCDTCQKFVPAKPDSHMIYHKVLRHAGGSERNHNEP